MQLKPPYILRGHILSPIADADLGWRLLHEPEGALAVDHNGLIVWSGSAKDCPMTLLGWPIQDTSHLIFPGFIDSHIHYPQYHVRVAFGADLLDWLERYTFPEEARFHALDYARGVAHEFTETILAHGVTTALTFSTSHTEAFLALTETAHRRGLSVITGITAMDRNAPDTVTRDLGYFREANAMAFAHLQHFPRLGYAITPRFALSCTEDLLDSCGTFVAAHPDIWVQSHVNENPDEIAMTQALFPSADSYVDVYARHGLLTPKTVLAHSIFSQDHELEQMAIAGTSVAHCPTSNTFLGSGLFRADRHLHADIGITLGSDIGGGTSYSPFATMAEAYKVGRLNGQSIAPDQLLYWHTLGSAQALKLDRVGTLTAGYWADFCLIDPTCSPLSEVRWNDRKDLLDGLFGLMFTLPESGGGVVATMTAGQTRWSQL